MVIQESWVTLGLGKSEVRQVQISVLGRLTTWWKNRSFLGRLAVVVLLVCLGIAAWWTWGIVSVLINPHSDPYSRDLFGYPDTLWWLSWGFIPLVVCGFLLLIIRLLIVVEDTLLRVLLVAVTTAIVIQLALWLI